MGRYDEDNYGVQGSVRQKDLVLSTNEFVFIQNKTNGQIRTYTGPIMVTISAQESMVIFNPKTKRFQETTDFEQARQLFTSAPENWYVVLKNPAGDGTHPDSAKASNSPELEIGKKINVSGPCSFSLFPGQMTRVIQGHRLRSNQYLLARVYDADAAEKSKATILDAEGNEVKSKEKYFSGQLLVIKGTEISFYIPPTGIEVIPVGGKGDTYVRDAITLERLEYSILKDEDGEKRYIHGPAVVFPKPTETFVESPKGGHIFRALELSPISGIYVKVIADYKDENGTEHKTGEELFITGKDQMIYYPRPEHAMIQYDGKYMHHAIAIPEGEGRYILNRLTGEIKTVKGPAMYLPDPRTEVVVKRKLSERECNLYYPGNADVLRYNLGLNERKVEQMAAKGNTSTTDAINNVYSTSNQLDTLAIFEVNANISRGVSYTKPRTITLDTKYEGVVSITVWTGYAICVVSKSGNRDIVVGPATRLLDYDESLESIVDAEGNDTVFLKLDNNRINDIISAITAEGVNVQLDLDYSVSFERKENANWFNINNYTSFITDAMRNAIKTAIQKCSVQDLGMDNATEIIRNVVLNNENTRKFVDNDSIITDVELRRIGLEKTVAATIERHRNEVLSKNLELEAANSKMEVIKALAEVEKTEAELSNANKMYQLALDNQYREEELAKEESYNAQVRAAKAAETQAKADLQVLLDAIQTAELARNKKAADETIRVKQENAKIEAEKQKVYAETVKSMMASVSPDLIAALTAKANAEVLTTGMKSMSPYAIANGESVSDTVNKLLRGTPLEGIIDNFTRGNE